MAATLPAEVGYPFNRRCSTLPKRKHTPVLEAHVSHADARNTRWRATPQAHRGKAQTSTISTRTNPADPTGKVQLISKKHQAFPAVVDTGIIQRFTDCILTLMMRNVRKSRNVMLFF